MKSIARLALIIFSPSIFFGCASIEQGIQISRTGTSKTIVGPDGSPHELVKCFDIEMCYAKATEVCTGKFKIVDNSTSYHDKDTVSLTSLLVKCGK